MKKIFAIIIGLLLLTQACYANEFIMSDIIENYAFSIDGETKGQTVGIIVSEKGLAWSDISKENIADSEVLYFNEYAALGGKYNFSFSLNCKSGLYNAVVGDENGEKLRDIDILFVNPSENKTAVEKLKNAAKTSKASMKAVMDENRYELAFYLPLTNVVEENVAVDAVYDAVMKDAGVSGVKLAEIYCNNLIIDGLNDKKINSLDEYYEYLNFTDANIDKWYVKALSKPTISAGVIGKNISDFDEFEDRLVEAMILDRVAHPDGYKNIRAILNDFSKKTGFSSSIVTDESCSAVAGKTYASYDELKTALTAAADSGSGNGGNGSNGGPPGGGGSFGGGGHYTIESPGNSGVIQPLNTEYFTDLAQYGWAKDAITNLYDMGIINGRGNGLFAPGDNVTREEFAKLIVLCADLKSASDETGFEDVPQDAWYAEYVKTLVGSGVTNGIDEKHFGVGQPITRQDMAVMIFRALNGGSGEYKEAEFSDREDISEYALGAVNFMSANGYITGYEDGSFKPLSSITRAETAVVLYRMLGN